jgi:hypothetical protein
MMKLRYVPVIITLVGILIVLVLSFNSMMSYNPISTQFHVSLLVFVYGCILIIIFYIIMRNSKGLQKNQEVKGES